MLLRNTLLVLLCVGFAFTGYSQEESKKATLVFLGGNFQKDPKLEIFINNKQIGYLTHGLELRYSTSLAGEVVIMTQGYNMIDAKYGPPVQLKLTVKPGETYYLDAKWTKRQHLTIITAEEVDKATKGEKKILSTIELGD